MGLGEADSLADGCSGGGNVTAALCSICLESVMDDVGRSMAKLKCGHQFHLDCIGSAFNIKGAMQCPNCRKIEKGQWLYANGSRPQPALNMEDWAHDEDLYDLGYSEMSFGVHWCPFSGLTRLLPTSFDEGEYSSSASHNCPYIAYFGSVNPSVSSGRVSDGFSFNNLWNGPSIRSEVPSSYESLSMDERHNSWDHFPIFAPSNHVAAVEQPFLQSSNLREYSSYDPLRPAMHHRLIVGNSSTGRAHSSVTSSMTLPYPGAVVRPRDHAPSLHTYSQRSNSSSDSRIPHVTGQGFSSHRGTAQLWPITSSPEESSGVCIFSSNSSGRTFQEHENTYNDRVHVSDREHQPFFPLNLIDRDSIWGPFCPSSIRSETGIRLDGFHQRQGASDRIPQNWP